MKLHSLSMSAFGPFKGTETIDFQSLNAAKLYLVTGPTGAGKTTILDAICFALYGETTGEGQGGGALDGRSGEELRSRDAADDQSTEVCLDFEVGGSQYRIERSPKQTRAAKRGGGKTDAVATVRLYRRDGVSGQSGTDTLIASQIKEAKEKVEQITGFTAEQFRRVVVIPQGRFRDVLVSDPGSREELLKRIFRTHRYERFEEIVKARAASAKAEREKVESERTLLLAEHEWTRDRDPVEVQEELESRLALAKQAEAAAIEVHEKAQVEREASVKALVEAERDEGLFAARDDARKARETALSNSEKIEASRRELDGARRAAEPFRLLKALQSRRKAAESAVQALPALERAHGVKQVMFNAADAAHQAASKAADDASGTRERMGRLQERIAAIDCLAKERKDAVVEVENLATKWTASLAALAEKDERLEKTKADLNAAEAALEDTQARYHDGVAGRLARELTKHSACPVCGSCEHPNPASLPEAIPSEADVEAARIAVEAARKAHRDAEADRATASGKLEAEKAVLAAKQEALSSRAAVPDKQALVDEHTAADARVKQVDGGLKAARESLETLRTERDRLKAEWDAAIEARRHTEQERAEAQREFDEAARSGAFETEAEVEALGRTAERITSLAEQVKKIDDALAEATIRLAQCEKQVEGKQQVDLVPLKARKEKAAADDQQAQASKAAASAACERLTTLVDKHADCMKRASQEEQQFRVAEKLNETIQGRGQVSFHRWVLGSVLEEVLAEATVVLRRISGNKYEFLRGQEHGDGRSRVGLDIEVFDTTAGGRRPARTLSGGETFLGSLSLALALARTTERRGGRRIDTMFIDEGFGSLDVDRLDDTLTALRSLSDEGRVVGVISHAEEMHRAIPAKLEVLPSRNGSSAATRITGVE